MDIKIKADDFGQMFDIDFFAEGVSEIAHKAAKKAGAEGRNNLKTRSPQEYGDYKAGWSLRNKSTVAGGIEYVIHNKTRYMLVHLLEDGHELIINGKRKGRVPAIKHYQHTVNEAGDKFVEYIEEGLQRIE